MAGLQFFDRMLLFLMPSKYQPNYVYLKYVRLSRVHLYTIVQVLQLLITSGVTRWDWNVNQVWIHQAVVL